MRRIENRNAPRPAIEPFFAPSGPDDLSGHRHRQLIGLFGMMLPLLLYVVAGVRYTAGLQPWRVLDSISAYYYTGAVAVFVGILVAMTLLLVTYRGYANEYHRSDQAAAIIAGVAALLVAFFPTGAPGELLTPSWWTPRTRTIHYMSAVVLFSAFVFFDVVLFPRSNVAQGQPRPPDKRWRNIFYRSAGVIILVCMLWAASSRFTGAPIFWPEAMALVFFALSWLVKGRADRTVVTLGKWTGYYRRHPGQLAGTVWRAVRG